MATGTAQASRGSLRLRLTLWVVAIFSVIQVSLGIVFHLYQNASLERFFDDRLRARASSLAASLSRNGEPFTDERLGVLAGEQIDDMFDRFTLTILDEDGRIVATSVDARRLVRDPAVVRGVATHEVETIRLPSSVLESASPGAHSARIAVDPIRMSDGRSYTLVAATTDAALRRTSDAALNVLMFMIPVGAVAAGLAGWFIAGLAVAPLSRAGAAAHRLSPESIHEEVQLESRDVESSALERELDDARKRMEAAFKAQERFMSNVSHELKTPISVILTESQVISLGEASEEVTDFVESVRDEMRRLGGMVDSFLLLTRVREGRAETIAQRCAVNDLVMDSVDGCYAWASQHQVRLEPTLIESEEMVDAAVEGDRRLLRTMLDNLIYNAIRFSPTGERVDVEARAEERGVSIAVRDRGPGIPASLINHVFDRFAQADEERRRGRGHGLGLEIAQGIAELHRGRISVRNLEDAGCEFVARLPHVVSSEERTDDSGAQPEGDGKSRA